MPPQAPEPDVPLFLQRTQRALDALRAGRLAALKPDPGPALAKFLHAALELEEVTNPSPEPSNERPDPTDSLTREDAPDHG